MTVHVHLVKREQWRCPVCGKRCGVYDHATAECFWRSMDFGPVPVRIGARLPRVNCPAHGVLTARVPWADAESRFTTDFAFAAAWMFKGGLSRKVRRHKEHILDTVRYGLSNARIESTNNKIKLLIRIAYGFRNIDAMIGLIMLFCSSIETPWLGRTARKPAK